jgi:hypothetical protein
MVPFFFYFQGKQEIEKRIGGWQLNEEMLDISFISDSFLVTEISSF